MYIKSSLNSPDVYTHTQTHTPSNPNNLSTYSFNEDMVCKWPWTHAKMVNISNHYKNVNQTHYWAIYCSSEEVLTWIQKKMKCALLLRMYNGPAAMENSVKIFDGLIIWSDDSICEYKPRIIGNMVWKRYLHNQIHNIIVHNSHEAEWICAYK